MKGIRRKILGVLVTAAAITAVMPVGVMAKTNSNPAAIASPKAVYADVDGTSDGTQVKALTLVRDSNNGQGSVVVRFDAILKNSVSTDYFVTDVQVADSSVSAERIYKGSVSQASADEYNTWKITGKADSKNTKLTVTYSVSNDNVIIVQKKEKGVTVSRNLTELAKKKTYNMNVKVVGADKMLALSGNKLGVLSENSSTPMKEEDNTSAVIVGQTKVTGIPVYKFNTESYSRSSSKYTVSINDVNGKKITDANKKLAFASSDKSVATISGKYDRKLGYWEATVTVKKTFYTDTKDGNARVAFTVAEKGAAAKYGKQAIYGNAAYFIMDVTPSLAANAKPKVNSAYTMVDGKKASSTVINIPAGSVSEDVILTTGYKSNVGAGTVSVNWTGGNEDLVLTKLDDNKWKLTAKGEVKRKITLKGTITAKNNKNGSTATKEVKLNVTAKKKVDTVKVSGYEGNHNYYATAIKTMKINGQYQKVRTFYYLAPLSTAISDTVQAESKNLNKLGKSEEFVPTDIKLKAVKNASDTALKSKASVTAKAQKSNKKIYDIALKINKFANDVSKADGPQYAVFQIAANDSYDKNSRQYGVGEYIAICVTPVESIGEGGFNNGTVVVSVNGVSTNKLINAGLEKGKMYELTSAVTSGNIDKDTIGYTSNNENVVIVESKKDNKTYAIVQGGAGVANIRASWAKVTLENKKYKQEIQYSSPVAIHTVDVNVPETITLMTAQQDEKSLISANYIMKDSAISANVVSQKISESKDKDGKDAAEDYVVTISKNGVISANNVGTAKITTKVKYYSDGVYPKEVTVEKTTTITVNPHSVKFTQSAYSFDLKNDRFFTPEISIDGGAATKADGNKIVLSVNKAGYAIVSKNGVDIEFNKDHRTHNGITLTAKYYDANGNYAGEASAPLALTDSSGNESKYEGKTVVSLNGIATKLDAQKDASITYNGTAGQLKNIYENLKKKLGKSTVVNGTVTVTVSYNKKENNSGNAVEGNDDTEITNGETASSDAAEPGESSVSGNSAEPEAATEDAAGENESVTNTENTGNESKPEDATVSGVNAVTEATEPEAEAAGAEINEIGEISEINEAAAEVKPEAVSGNASVSENANVSVNEAEAEDTASEEEAEKTAETDTDVPAEEPVPAEETDGAAKEVKPAEEAEPAVDTAETTGEPAAEKSSTVKEVVTVTIANGQITSGDTEITNILNKIAAENNKVTMCISDIDLNGLTIAEIVGQLNTAADLDDGAKEDYATTATIELGGHTYEISGLKYVRAESTYKATVKTDNEEKGVDYVFYIESDAKNTRVIIDRKVTDENLIVNLQRTRIQIITGATYYDSAKQ